MGHFAGTLDFLKNNAGSSRGARSRAVPKTKTTTIAPPPAPTTDSTLVQAKHQSALRQSLPALLLHLNGTRGNRLVKINRRKEIGLNKVVMLQ